MLVSAPAGFGKTTFLSEWARNHQPATTTSWLSLDDGDNDPVRFWDHFIAALAPLRPDAGQEALGLLHSLVPLQPESFLVALTNSLAAVETDSVLVLDDYHVIESPAVHSGITFLLDHMPAHVRLILAGRAEPPCPLLATAAGECCSRSVPTTCASRSRSELEILRLVAQGSSNCEIAERLFGFAVKPRLSTSEMTSMNSIQLAGTVSKDKVPRHRPRNDVDWRHPEWWESHQYHKR